MRRETSTDGLLTLELFEEDDYYIGFVEQAWHTHGDLLAPDYGASPRLAALGFFESVVSDNEVICVSETPDGQRSIWITDDPAEESRYTSSGERLSMRLWSGTCYQPITNTTVA